MSDGAWAGGRKAQELHARMQERERQRLADGHDVILSDPFPKNQLRLTDGDVSLTVSSGIAHLADNVKAPAKPPETDEHRRAVQLHFKAAKIVKETADVFDKYRPKIASQPKSASGRIRGRKVSGVVNPDFLRSNLEAIERSLRLRGGGVEGEKAEVLTAGQRRSADRHRNAEVEEVFFQVQRDCEDTIQWQNASVTDAASPRHLTIFSDGGDVVEEKGGKSPSRRKKRLSARTSSRMLGSRRRPSTASRRRSSMSPTMEPADAAAFTQQIDDLKKQVDEAKAEHASLSSALENKTRLLVVAEKDTAHHREAAEELLKRSNTHEVETSAARADRRLFQSMYFAEREARMMAQHDAHSADALTARVTELQMQMDAAARENAEEQQRLCADLARKESELSALQLRTENVHEQSWKDSVAKTHVLEALCDTDQMLEHAAEDRNALMQHLSVLIDAFDEHSAVETGGKQQLAGVMHARRAGATLLQRLRESTAAVAKEKGEKLEAKVEPAEHCTQEETPESDTAATPITYNDSVASASPRASDGQSACSGAVSPAEAQVDAERNAPASESGIEAPEDQPTSRCGVSPIAVPSLEADVPGGDGVLPGASVSPREVDAGPAAMADTKDPAAAEAFADLQTAYDALALRSKDREVERSRDIAAMTAKCAGLTQAVEQVREQLQDAEGTIEVREAELLRARRRIAELQDRLDAKEQGNLALGEQLGKVEELTEYKNWLVNRFSYALDEVNELRRELNRGDARHAAPYKHLAALEQTHMALFDVDANPSPEPSAADRHRTLKHFLVHGRVPTSVPTGAGGRGCAASETESERPADVREAAVQPTGPSASKSAAILQDVYARRVSAPANFVPQPQSLAKIQSLKRIEIDVPSSMKGPATRWHEREPLASDGESDDELLFRADDYHVGGSVSGSGAHTVPSAGAAHASAGASSPSLPGSDKHRLRTTRRPQSALAASLRQKTDAASGAPAAEKPLSLLPHCTSFTGDGGPETLLRIMSGMELDASPYDYFAKKESASRAGMDTAGDRKHHAQFKADRFPARRPPSAAASRSRPASAGAGIAPTTDLPLRDPSGARMSPALCNMPSLRPTRRPSSAMSGTYRKRFEKDMNDVSLRTPSPALMATLSTLYDKSCVVTERGSDAYFQKQSPSDATAVSSSLPAASAP